MDILRYRKEGRLGTVEEIRLDDKGGCVFVTARARLLMRVPWIGGRWVRLALARWKKARGKIQMVGWIPSAATKYCRGKVHPFMSHLHARSTDVGIRLLTAQKGTRVVQWRHDAKPLFF